MKVVRFDANGGRLMICIEVGHAQIGSYRLRLWEPGSNTVVLDESGNNQNPNDDCHELPLPTANNDGRLVQCEFSVLSPAPAPGDMYSVAMVFKQGGNTIETVSESG
ncbi:MAG: hypothetical protein HW407_966, partial [Bacteroidetes bacterium]|nr:hypothetical protein [Bacteroidota bacterium]